MWPQEPDELAAAPIRAVTIGAVVLTLALSAMAGGLQAWWRGVLGGPRPLPEPIEASGTPPSGLFGQAQPERTELPTQPVWADKEQGIVALPPEQAIELVLREPQ